jgi:hypothetical protein
MLAAQIICFLEEQMRIKNVLDDNGLQAGAKSQKRKSER